VFEHGPVVRCGRLAAGVRHRIDYEGQAAIELEALAESAGDRRGSSLQLTVRADGVIDPPPWCG